MADEEMEADSAKSLPRFFFSGAIQETRGHHLRACKECGSVPDYNCVVADRLTRLLSDEEVKVYGKIRDLGYDFENWLFPLMGPITGIDLEDHLTSDLEQIEKPKNLRILTTKPAREDPE